MPIMQKVKRISAIIGIILVLSMYILSFVAAIFATEKAPGLFLASIFSTLVIPILIHLFYATYKWVHRNDPSKDDNANSEDN